MTCDNAEHNAQESPAQESDNRSKHDVGQRIGEALILSLYLVIDAFEVWPHHPLLAAAAVPIGVLALLLLDGGFSKKRVAAVTAVATVLAVIAYFVMPPELPVETDTHGWLESAGESLPADNACTSGGDVQTLRPNGMLFTLGKAGMWFQKRSDGVRPLLTVGACTLMTAEFKDDELMFNVDIYDTDRQLAARIERNEFHLVPGKFAYQERPNRSTLKVFNKEGKLLLSVHRRNKDAIDVGGDFTCSDGKEAKVEKDGQLTMTGPKGTLTWGGPCLINTGGFVVSEYGFAIGSTPCWACTGPTCPLICARERARAGTSQ